MASSAIGRLLNARDTHYTAQRNASFIRALQSRQSTGGFQWNGLGSMNYGGSGGNYGSPGGEYGNWWYGTSPMGLARPPEVFTEGGFAPVTPIPPMAIDTAPEGLPRPQPRRFEYWPAWNMPTPPGSEGLRLASYAMMRQYADIDTILRACIDKRMEEVVGMEWDIVPTNDVIHKMQDKAFRKDWEARRMVALRFWLNPDPDYNGIHTWLKALLEDLFVIDAVSLYLAPRLDGDLAKTPFNAGLQGLLLLDGSTIRPMLDLSGGRPSAPNVAFQQYIWGVPRVDLLDALTQDEMDQLLDPSAKVADLRGDQLLYLPYHKRTKSPYGFSHVEKTLLPTGIDLNKEKYILAYYTEGNTPSSWVTIGNVETPQQARQWQDSLDAMIGDIGNRHQVFVLPHGSSAIETKPNIFRDEYDTTNREVLFSIFGLTAIEMGFLPGGKAGGLSGGSGQADAAQSTKIRTATRPLLLFLKRQIFDFILQEVWDQKDMQWQWAGLLAPEDEQLQMQEDVAFVNSGIRARDEIRRKRGWSPFNLPMTQEPTVTAGPTVQSLAGTPSTGGVGPSGDTATSQQAQTINEVKVDNAKNPPLPVQLGPGGVPQGAKKPMGSRQQADTRSPGSVPRKVAPTEPQSSNDTNSKKLMHEELQKLRDHLDAGGKIEEATIEVLPQSITDFVAKNVAISTAFTYSVMHDEIDRSSDEMYARFAEKVATALIAPLSASEREAAIREVLIETCVERAVSVPHSLDSTVKVLVQGQSPVEALQAMHDYWKAT